MDPIQQRTHVPPRILIDQIDPTFLAPAATLVRATRDSCHCQVELGLQVAMDDVVADLDVRWFYDYDPANSSTWNIWQPSQADGSFDVTRIVRTVPAQVFDPDLLALADGVHTVDVVIAERGAFDDGAANPVAPKRTVAAGYEAATYRFVIRVVTDPDIARCPQRTPFIREAACAARNP